MTPETTVERLGRFFSPRSVALIGATDNSQWSVFTYANLRRYSPGVKVHLVHPRADTVHGQERGVSDPAPGEWDARHPGNVSPLVAWLASRESGHVTGRVFNVAGGRISVAEGWHAGPGVDRGGRWDAEDLGPVVTSLVEQAAPNAETNGRIPASSS